MKQIYSNRILESKPSFVREILKYASQPGMISFAGGLPNPIAIPTKALALSSTRVIKENGYKTFQYSNSEGLLPLRELIAKRYYDRFHYEVSADEILITTGSQQANDLVGKVLLNKGDKVLIEKPAYLGAIQILSMYEPKFLEVDLEEDGPDLNMLEDLLKTNDIKLMYTVPNFQNPTGITYSLEKRKKICELLNQYQVVLIEDDPYGDLRFQGMDLPYIGADKLEHSILFGSFSKIISPGVRIGYLCTKDKELMQKLIIAKQATDLHTDILAQHILYDYLIHNDLEEHISDIKHLYRKQSSTMIECLNSFLSSKITFTKPEGGMFLWAKRIDNGSAKELFHECINSNVAFVPGDPFYINATKAPTFRLNYTNSNEDEIIQGVKRIAKAI